MDDVVKHHFNDSMKCGNLLPSSDVFGLRPPAESVYCAPKSPPSREGRRAGEVRSVLASGALDSKAQGAAGDHLGHVPAVVR